MLINAHSVKKHNAVFHLSTDLAAQSIDWCFVAESWLNSDIDDIFILIPNYNLFRCDRSAKNSKKNLGGGVCSYVRSNFLSTLIYPEDNEQFEVLWLEIDIMSLCALICVVYYPPLCEYDMDQCAKLIQAYEHLCLAKNYWQLITCGDFNDFCTGNVFTECNLTQINFEPTHNTKVLDQLLVSCPWNVSTVRIVIPTISTDHDSVLCSLQIPKNRKKSSISETNVKVAAKCVTNFFVMRIITVCTDQWIKRNTVSTKFYHVFRISHLLSNSPSDCP